MIATAKSQPKVASLFSGCGGFDLGFQIAGYQSVGAFDICPDVLNVFRNNVHENCTLADLTTASVTRTSVGRPDVVIAGSPCQGFSTLGLNKTTDPRNSLYIRGAQIAARLAPKAIVLENVGGILSSKMRSHLASAISCIEAAGYFTRIIQLKCADHGVAQIRKRVFLFASKSKSALLELQLELRPKQSLRKVLSGVQRLPNHAPKELIPTSDEFKIACQIKPHQKLCNVRGGERSVPTWEIPTVFGRTTKREREILCILRRLRRQIRTRTIGDADPVMLSDLNAAHGTNVRETTARLVEKGYIRKIGRRFDLTNTFNGKFRRLSYSHPSPAVDTKFGTPAYFLHPAENRGFSVREAARIQGFPDDFVFEGTISKQFQMIGNAVPVPVAECVGEAVKRFLL